MFIAPPIVGQLTVLMLLNFSFLHVSNRGGAEHVSSGLLPALCLLAPALVVLGLPCAAEDIKAAVLSGKLSVNKAYVVTMEKVNTGKFKTEAEKKKAFLTALKIDIIKIIKTRIALEQKRHPDFRLTGKEAAKLLKEFSKTLKTELDKLTMKGTN